MTAYFDELNAEIRLRGTIEGAIEIERELVSMVKLVVGDREFPDELREKILRVIAIKRIDRPETGDLNPRSVEWFNALKRSILVQDLHAAFHEVARRRIETRFGVLTDSPRDIVARRDADCNCVLDCSGEDRCSHSGQRFHVHPDDGTGVFGACPAHPDAPGDL